MDEDTLDTMLQLADRYADELSAQFRTLNYFVQHAGEIGRAHETYLRAVIERFLPGSSGIGTGFIVSDKWASAQQDIIIYDKLDYPHIFQVGGCVVVDFNAVAATLEVKTTLGSKKTFLDAYRKLANFYDQIGHSRFVGLFAWDGISLDATLSAIWEYVRESPLKNLHNLPNLLYIRSKYMILHNIDGRRETPPFRVFKISENGITEGQALLTMMVEIWEAGYSKFPDFPWWLSAWRRKLPEIQSLISWPEDLQEIINSSINP